MAPPATANPTYYPQPVAVAPTKSPAWHYFTTKRPDSIAAFRGLLSAKSNEGWEYVGSETFTEASDVTGPVVLVVFKKPAPQFTTILPTVNPQPNPFYDTPGYTYPPGTTPSSNNPVATQPRLTLPSSNIPPTTPPTSNRRTLTPQPSQPLPATDQFETPLPTLPPAPATERPVPVRPSSPAKRVERIPLQSITAEDAAQQIESFAKTHKWDKPRSVNVIADAATNSVLVQSDSATLDDVAQLMRMIDRPKLTSLTPPKSMPPSLDAKPSATVPPSNDSEAVYHVFRLKRADAQTVADSLQKFNDPKKKITLAVDARTNSIVFVGGTAKDIENAAKAIQKMDHPEEKPIAPAPTKPKSTPPAKPTEISTTMLIPSRLYGKFDLAVFRDVASENGFSIEVKESADGMYLQITGPESTFAEVKETYQKWLKSASDDKPVKP